jgi:iron complex outermembrane receptor protein
MKTSMIALSFALSLATPAFAADADTAETEADNSILVIGQKDAPIEIAPR